MNSSDQDRRNAAADENQLSGLLSEVRLRFYTTQRPARFHRDRRMLLYALSWPAVWLERRGLFCSSRRYRALIVERLDAIHAHGDPARYGDYFPRYLLKCLQDFFDRHGDELDGELKHIRNALDQVCGSLRFAEPFRQAQGPELVAGKASLQSRQIETLAAVHRMLRAQAPAPPDPRQMGLF